MLAKEELRAILKESLDTTIQEVNRALNGENTEQLVDVLTRVGHMKDYWVLSMMCWFYSLTTKLLRKIHP